MKNILYCFVALFLVFILSSCGEYNSTNSSKGTQTNAQTTVTLVADKTQVLSDGTDGVTLTVTVTDETGSPLTQQYVSFNVPYILSNSNTPFTPLITDEKGQVVLFLKPTFRPQNDVPAWAGLSNINASCLGVTSNTILVKIYPGPHQITSSVTLVSDKVQAIADGRDTITFTATVKDIYGDPIAGQIIDFTFPPSTSPFIISPRYTDNNGVAVINLTYPPSQQRLLSTDLSMSATSGGVTSNNVAVSYIMASPSLVTLVADKTLAVADGQDRITFTATVKDANGLPMPYLFINFTVSPGANRYMSPVFTDSKGIAVIQLSVPPSSKPETVINVTATSGGITSNIIAVSYSAPPQVTPAIVTLTSDKTVLIADGIDRVVFTMTSTDLNGKPLAGQLTHLNLPYGPYMVLIRGTTDTAGKATATLMRYANSLWPASALPTSISITATVNGANSNAVNITINPPL